MSKQEYFLQKGLQVQQLSQDIGVLTSSTATKSPREVARLRVLCPPGVEDARIMEIIQDTKGHSGRIESAISELWENHHGQQDEWAVVSKKGKKKNEALTRSNGKAGFDRTNENEQKDRVRNHGKSEKRPRGRGHGRPGPVPKSKAKTDNSSEDVAVSVQESVDVKLGETEKEKTVYHKRESRSLKVSRAPPVVQPVLKGAWVKKPNLGIAGKKPSTLKTEEPGKLDTKNTTRKNRRSLSKSPLNDAGRAEAATDPVFADEKAEETVSKEVDSPQKKVEPNIISPEKEPQLESTGIASAWGSLDVTRNSLSDWATAADTSNSVAANAWARSSQILNVQSTEPAPSLPTVIPGSPKDTELSRPESSLTCSPSASPKQYLKMGKWDSAAATNITLQFGSFSLGSSGHNDSAASPRGWGTTPSSNSVTATASAIEDATNAWSSQSSSSPKKKTVLKRPLEADHLSSQLHQALNSEEAVMSRKSMAAAANSGPPGLSVQTDRLTPKASQSPQYVAPSAPSPATLPKPEEVKLSSSTPQQTHFTSHTSNSSQQNSKLGIGNPSNYGSEFSTKSLYQSPYGQYSMELVGNRNSTGAAGSISQNQMIAGNAHKVHSARSVSGGHSQSPTHGQSVQLQHLQRQMQPSQQTLQNKPQTQQTSHGQQPQNQTHPHSQNSQQSMTAHFQSNQPGLNQSFHPQFAPPPPPGMSMPYNPYNYPGYYQGYGYYQSPQYHQYSPRSQYPSRGGMPYGMESPMPGFTNPPGYQEQHIIGHQHEFNAASQGFCEMNGAYPQQSSQPHMHPQSSSQNHGKGNANTLASNGQRSNIASYQGVSNANTRDHSAVPPAPNTSAAMSSNSYSSNQHYGWQSYGNQPMGNWNHLAPQSYQQNPSMHQQSSLHPQQSYRQYANSVASTSNPESNLASTGHGHNTWSS